MAGITKCSIVLAKNPLSNINIDAKRILLVKLDHIGDFMTSLPAIGLVRAKFPKANITLLVGTWNQTLANRIKEVDTVITFDFFNRISEEYINKDYLKQVGRLQKLLKSSKFDLAIDLRRHPETRWTLFLSEAKYKVGYITGNYSYDSLLDIGLQHPPNKGLLPHISSQIFNLVKSINPDVMSFIQSPELSFVDGEVEHFKSIRTDILSNKKIICIAPGVGSLIRQWRPKYYYQLINLITECSDAHVVLLGSPPEYNMVSLDVYKNVKDKKRVTNLAGKLSITNAALMIKHSNLFIGNNSGMGHIAGYLNIPTLIMFSGQVEPTEWHPLGDKTYIVTAEVDCAPCYLGQRKDCTNDLQCLNLITPGDVYREVERILNE